MYEYDFFIYRLSHHFRVAAKQSLNRDNRTFLVTSSSKEYDMFVNEIQRQLHESTEEEHNEGQVGVYSDEEELVFDDTN